VMTVGSCGVVVVVVVVDDKVRPHHLC